MSDQEEGKKILPSAITSTSKNTDSKTVVRGQINSDEENSKHKKVGEASKKPLLNDDDEKNSEVTIVINENEDGGSLPPKEEEPGNKESGADEPPSMFLSPFGRMKYDWEHSNNLIEFFTRVVYVIFASVGWIILVGGIPFMSIIELIIGSVYLNDCPADHRIPKYLIVSGFFGTLLHFISVCTKYIPKAAKDAMKVHRRRCLCIEAILQVFLFIFFIAGCSWVYSIYEPDYENTDRDEYCHKGLYLFTFWMFNLTFIIVVLIVAFGICGIACIALDNSPKRNVVQK